MLFPVVQLAIAWSAQALAWLLGIPWQALAESLSASPLFFLVLAVLHVATAGGIAGYIAVAVGRRLTPEARWPTVVVLTTIAFAALWIAGDPDRLMPFVPRPPAPIDGARAENPQWLSVQRWNVEFLFGGGKAATVVASVALGMALALPPPPRVLPSFITRLPERLLPARWWTTALACIVAVGGQWVGLASGASAVMLSQEAYSDSPIATPLALLTTFPSVALGFVHAFLGGVLSAVVGTACARLLFTRADPRIAAFAMVGVAASLVLYGFGRDIVAHDWREIVASIGDELRLFEDRVTVRFTPVSRVLRLLGIIGGAWLFLPKRFASASALSRAAGSSRE